MPTPFEQNDRIRRGTHGEGLVFRGLPPPTPDSQEAEPHRSQILGIPHRIRRPPAETDIIDAEHSC